MLVYDFNIGRQVLWIYRTVHGSDVGHSIISFLVLVCQILLFGLIEDHSTSLIDLTNLSGLSLRDQALRFLQLSSGLRDAIIHVLSICSQIEVHSHAKWGDLSAIIQDTT